MTLLSKASCEAALVKVGTDASIGQVTAKYAKASIYSNLAVAKAMGGDMIGTGGDLKKALSLNARDRNALSNYSLVSDLIPAAELAQGI